MNLICAIHQPNFLPWAGFFHKIIESDVFVLLDNVDLMHGSKISITNRTKIKTPNGEQWLTIPIQKNNSKIIKEIEMVQSPWRDKMLKTIELNYKKSKNFTSFYPVLESIIRYESTNLSDFNTNAIIEICNYLSIETPIIKSSDLNISTTNRNERIIEICKKCNANTYFSGNGGKKYHDENSFNLNQITIKYTTYSENEYPQLFGKYLPGLSIVDQLFNITS